MPFDQTRKRKGAPLAQAIKWVFILHLVSILDMSSAWDDSSRGTSLMEEFLESRLQASSEELRIQI